VVEFVVEKVLEWLVIAVVPDEAVLVELSARQDDLNYIVVTVEPRAVLPQT
jgi:hypothetical protein